MKDSSNYIGLFFFITISKSQTKNQLGKYNFFAEIDNIGDISLL